MCYLCHLMCRTYAGYALTFCKEAKKLNKLASGCYHNSMVTYHILPIITITLTQRLSKE